MSVFAAAPFLGPVIGPVVGGFVSQYGMIIQRLLLTESELEMDILDIVDFCIRCYARYYLSASGDIHKDIIAKESPAIEDGNGQR
jgi:hypothetical protein